MSQHPHQGPLHLRNYLDSCSEPLDRAIRQSVEHPVSLLRGLACGCRASAMLQAAGPRPSGRSSVELVSAKPKVAEDAGPGQSGSRQGVGGEKRETCRLFSVEVNEEDGLVKAFCRRCQKLFIIYDQALYWGMRRKTGVIPKTYPYRCSCGGHTYEIGVGFDYYEDAMDENDLRTITVAVRCSACEEISMILDDEAS